jgi:hypothetical protein
MDPYIQRHTLSVGACVAVPHPHASADSQFDPGDNVQAAAEAAAEAAATATALAAAERACGVVGHRHLCQHGCYYLAYRPARRLHAVDPYAAPPPPPPPSPRASPAKPRAAAGTSAAASSAAPALTSVRSKYFAAGRCVLTLASGESRRMRKQRKVLNPMWELSRGGNYTTTLVFGPMILWCSDHCVRRVVSEHETVVERLRLHAECCPCGGGDVNRDTNSMLYQKRNGVCMWCCFLVASSAGQVRVDPTLGVWGAQLSSPAAVAVSSPCRETVRRQGERHGGYGGSGASAQPVRSVGGAGVARPVAAAVSVPTALRLSAPPGVCYQRLSYPYPYPFCSPAPI